MSNRISLGIIRWMMMVFLSGTFVVGFASASRSVLDSAVTRDLDGNGYIDHIELIFDTNTTISTGLFSNFTVIFGATSLPVSGLTMINSTHYQLTVQEPTNQGSVLQTSWTPTVTTALIPNVENRTIMCLDGCAPVIVSISKVMNDPNDRTKDTIVAVLSEKIRSPNGSTFVIMNDPSQVFSTWWGATGTASADSLLAGIPGFTRIEGDSILCFTMNNGKELTSDNLLSIKGYPVLLVDSYGNAPTSTNRRVHVVTGFADGYGKKVMAFPNPTFPTLKRVQGDTIVVEIVLPGARSLTKDWTITDKAGVVLSISGNLFKGYLPAHVRCEIYGYDLYNRPIASANKVVELFPGKGIYANSKEMNFYWNGFNKYGRFIPGIYTAKVKMVQGPDSWESSVNIVMRGSSDFGRNGIVGFDSLGNPIKTEPTCGHGFILAFIPPLSFKLNSLFCRKKTKKASRNPSS
jgi:hypothetical protein